MRGRLHHSRCATTGYRFGSVGGVAYKARRRSPKKLFLTHFGVVHDVEKHLSEMRRRLRAWAGAVHGSLEDDSESDAVRAKAFHASEMKQMHALVDESFREPYNFMGQPRESWYGLARYWRKMDR